MPGLDTGKAPANYVVLPFYGTGAIGFLVLTFLLLNSSFQGEELFGGFFNPHILSYVHTAALGWGTMVILGASYQLLPVITEHDLYSEPLGLVSYFFFVPGVLLAIPGFWHLSGVWLDALIWGASLILIAALLYFYNVVMTVIPLKGFNAQRYFLITSGFWLVLTITIGILLALNLKYQYITSRSHLEILKLHAHVGLAGWFLQLIVGVSVKLVPMFILGHGKKDRWLQWAFVLQNSGLVLFLLDGYFNGPSYRYLIYEALVVAGVAFWLAYLWDAKKHRIKKPLDHQMYHTFMAFVALLIAFLLIPVVYIYGGQWVMVYGLFVFVGWISSLILGMTFKTLPFIIWNNKYKGINGIAKIPLPKELFWGKLVKIQFWVYVSALYVVALSLIFKAIWPLRFGLALLFLTALIYIVNTFKTLTHRRAKVIEKKNIQVVNNTTK